MYKMSRFLSKEINGKYDINQRQRNFKKASSRKENGENKNSNSFLKTCSTWSPSQCIINCNSLTEV